jgi:antirestriction protein ArdC
MRNIHKTLDRIDAQLKAGTVPWRQPWSGKAGGAVPRNAVTGRAYSGVNVVLLWSTDYADNRWLTFKQALELGGSVRKGEHGEKIVFVTFLEREDKKTGKQVRVPMLREYSVFNVAQCDGLSFKAPREAKINPGSRVEVADEFLEATGADIRHGFRARRKLYRLIDHVPNGA